MSENTDELDRLLRTQPARLQFLSELSAADRKALAGDIGQARKAHSRHIREKMEEALGHLPWLIRVPVKKLFGL